MRKYDDQMINGDEDEEKKGDHPVLSIAYKVDMHSNFHYEYCVSNIFFSIFSDFYKRENIIRMS